MLQMISVRKTAEYFDSRCGQEHLQVRDMKLSIKITKEGLNSVTD